MAKQVGQNITQKLLCSHIVSGKAEKGGEIGIKIDQTLTQDATGTMVYLELESMGIDRVKTSLSVAYIDHNTLQAGFENADDHNYIKSCARRYGIHYSPPGNGICHQVHLERFGVPGMTLIGSDSHTPTCGGLGMLAIGAGGLDVACAMAGLPYFITMPEIIKVDLTGELGYMVSAKDAILFILKTLSVKGGVGKIFEYGGEGVKTLSVPERATIANMGAELGATTSVFPSDEITREFLAFQGREGDYTPVFADSGAVYDGVIKINLSEIPPMAACPHSPDNVREVSALEKENIKVDQCCIGSCTNSSYDDLMKAAAILWGNKVNPDVSLTVSPGSRQVLEATVQSGGLLELINAGARVLESACGPCIGMGQAPKSGGVSLRTFNRNFKGRSGTSDASVYLVSPETAAYSAIHGRISDPRGFTGGLSYSPPPSPDKSDKTVIPPLPPEKAKACEIVRGPNIKPFPVGRALEGGFSTKAALVTGDNITTDHIMPAGAKILPYRSNIPFLSRFCFAAVDETFPERIKSYGSGLIIAGENYGQGSSREHASLVPLYLGVRCVAAKSFARIHRGNLINAGIIPLTFINKGDYDGFSLGDEIEFSNIRSEVEGGINVTAVNKTKGKTVVFACSLSVREREYILSGGLINAIREKEKSKKGGKRLDGKN